jgi:hypothetical protein
MITDGIITYLKAFNNLSPIQISPVGSVKNLKSPFVIYHVATAQALYSSQGDTGLQLARFQFDVYSATSYTEARTVATTLRDALNTLMNTTLDDPESTFVYAAFSDPPVDLSEIPKGNQTVEYRVMVQSDIHFLDSAYVQGFSS